MYKNLELFCMLFINMLAFLYFLTHILIIFIFPFIHSTQINSIIKGANAYKILLFMRAETHNYVIKLLIISLHHVLDTSIVILGLYFSIWYFIFVSILIYVDFLVSLEIVSEKWHLESVHNGKCGDANHKQYLLFNFSNYLRLFHLKF